MDDNLTKAIENVNNKRDQLLALTESFHAAKHILDAYAHYNRLMLIGKLRAYIAAMRESDRAAAEFEQLSLNKTETENGVVLNYETILRLRNENNECEQIISGLTEKHKDEAEATKRLTHLKVEAGIGANFLEKKREDILKKKAQISKCRSAIQTLEVGVEWHLGRINNILTDLSRLADEAAFEKHEHIAMSFKAGEEYDFHSIKEEIIRHNAVLWEGARLFEELGRHHAHISCLKEGLDNINLVLESNSKEFTETDAAFRELKSELNQALADWAAGNTRLTVLPGMIEDMNNAVNSLRFTDERLNLTPFIDELLFALRGAADQKIGARKVYLSGLNEKKSNKQVELRRLREVSTKDASIGAAAGESRRQAAIRALQVEIEGFVRQIGDCEAEIEALKTESADLLDEYKRMPNSDKLAETAKVMRNLNVNAGIARIEFENLTNRIIHIEKDIHNLDAQIDKLCGKMCLPAGIEAYKAALDSIRQYNYDLTDLINEHNNLLMNAVKITEMAERFEALETDLDNLTYDAAELERRQGCILTEINAIEEQLRASGYEEAVQIIGAKSHRTEEIRNCLDILQKTAGALETKLKYLDDNIENTRRVKTICQNELAVIKRALEDEAALMYTDVNDLNTDDRNSVNKALNRLELEKRDFMGISVEEMEKEVLSRLYGNLQYLAEYAPKEEEIFEQHSEIGLKIKRVDITCMVEGREIGIAALYSRLEKEVENRRE